MNPTKRKQNQKNKLEWLIGAINLISERMHLKDNNLVQLCLFYKLNFYLSMYDKTKIFSQLQKMPIAKIKYDCICHNNLFLEPFFKQ